MDDHYYDNLIGDKEMLLFRLEMLIKHDGLMVCLLVD